MPQINFSAQLKSYFIVLVCSLLAQISFAQVTYEQAFPNLSFQYAAEIQNANDGSDRLFVVEQSGRIKVFPNDNAVTSAQMNTFLDLSNVVSFSSGQEIGLLGLAFHPNYAQNGHFYVYHTRQSSVANISVEIVIARYTVSSNNPNIANPNSRLEIFRVDKNQNNSNHNGGKIAFGPDGYLYASIGDGGGGGDPRKNAQNLENAFGSMLRLDVDLDGNNPVETNPALPNGNYEIPSDNPRVGQSGLDELYAWGIRNTWKFSFDNTNNRLWAADVGQDGLEEINLIQKGGNYGWNRFEGNNSYSTSTTLATNPDTKPVFTYNHNNGDVSITGGYVYRGASANPALQGKYIYGDYVSGRVWAMNYNEATNTATSELLFRTNGQFISSFGLDEAGELYFSDYGTNAKLYKIVGGNTGPQTIAVNGVGSWANPGTVVSGIIESVAMTANDSIVVGGEFTLTTDTAVANLALYHPETGWSSFGASPNGKINAVAIAPDGSIYIGGSFSQIGEIQVNNVAKWDGSTWTALGEGTNGPVGNIGIDSDNTVYIGGAFESAGGLIANNIAMWSDNSWSVLADGSTTEVGTNNEIRAIAFDEANNLYVGGNFDSAGGKPSARIAIWDGTNWGALGEGTSGFVQAIVITPTTIYAGGNFSIAGTETVNRIAQWDRSGQNWLPLGNGLSGNVRTLAYDGTYLYAGGSFQTASDIENVNKIVNNTARWSDAMGWEAMGIGTAVGVNTQVNSFAFSNDNTLLYTVGNFNLAGLIGTSNIAIWGLDLGCIETAIIPEYRLNGTWASGQADLTVDEETEVVLSILPNGINFTITFPDGTLANGDQNLGNVSPTQSGLYVFETEEGCTLNFNLLIIPEEEEEVDDDGDGVPNAEDECPDTPVGTVVDEKGCPISSLPVDNFQISTTSASCNDADTGMITVVSELPETYTAELSGENGTTTYNFTDVLEISALSSGTYDLCLSTDANPEDRQCSTLQISQPNPLSVSAVLDLVTSSVTLTMKGAPKYIISLNGLPMETEQSEITLALEKENNDISVSTDLECQGSFTESFSLRKNYIMDENPIQENISVFLGMEESGNTILASLFTLSGHLISSNSYQIHDGKVIVDAAILSKGLYFLRLTKDNLDLGFKVIKN